MKNIAKIAFGGSCHWCTEAVFQFVNGVVHVEQGFVSAMGAHYTLSEAVVVHFDPALISLQDLVEIHLFSHKCTSNHAMRSKYRSAVYSFSEQQQLKSIDILLKLKGKFAEPILTEVLRFKAFEPSDVQFTDYYIKNPERPFCRTYIQPKLDFLLQKFSDKIGHRALQEE